MQQIRSLPYLSHEPQDLPDTSMYLQFIRQMIRSLLRTPLLSTMHIFGLSIGFAVCATIAIFVTDELSFDRYHENYDTIYRLVTANSAGASGTMNVPFTVASLGRAMQERIPEVESFTRIFSVFNWSVIVDGSPEQVQSMVAVDPSYFDLFTVPLVHGDPATVLTEPDHVVINESLAERFFGTDNPVGEMLVFEGNRTMEIVGVMQDFPDNSHLNLEMLLPIQIFENDPEWAWINEWYTSAVTYVQLTPDADPDELTKSMNEIQRELLPELDGLYIWLQPLSDIHLHASNVQWDFAQRKSNILYPVLFSGIGLGVLLLACANFINLTTSRSLQRAGEVGIRKMVGASRKQLVVQFTGESVLLALIALPLAVFSTEALLPYINTLIDRNLENVFLQPTVFTLIFILFTLVTGILAGYYPAFVLSGIQPLRNVRSGGKRGTRGRTLRKILVTFQFVLSILLLLVTGTILTQIHYLRSQPLGFNRDHMVSVRIADESNQVDHIPLRDEITADTGVRSACLSQVVPGIITAEDHVVPEGMEGEDPITINMNIVCDQFVETVGLEIIEGRNFDPARPADHISILINEAAMRRFGWETAEGKTLRGSSGRVFPITGVVRDYHFMSLHKAIEPQMLIYYPIRGEYLSFYVHEEGMRETIERVETIWNRHVPHRPFEYFFLDDALNNWYANEERLSKLLTVFSSLALLISSLGIIGLISHATQQRRGEIGIRKVLGANISSILLLILGEFFLLVGIANLVSWPIAVYIGNLWIENFAFRTPTPWWLLPAAVVLSFFLVLMVTGSITWRAATANPVHSIREE